MPKPAARFVCCLALLFTASANAAIIYLADNRYARSDNTAWWSVSDPFADPPSWSLGSPDPSFYAQPTSSYNDFHVDYAGPGYSPYSWVSQSSNLTVNSMAGSGSVQKDWSLAAINSSYYADNPNFLVESVFDVTFTVDHASDFQLSGLLDGWLGGNYTNLVLRDGNSIMYSLDPYTTDNSNWIYHAPFSDSGQFLPGHEYRLAVGSSSNYAWDPEAWGFNLTVTSAVPLPSAAWLLGSGLISLVGLRRRKCRA